MTTPLAPKHPKWLRDIAHLLSIRAQFVLSGNIRDRVLIRDTKPRVIGVYAAFWDLLQPLGFEGLLIWDVVDGLQTYPQDQALVDRLSSFCDLDLSQPQPFSLPALATLLRRINAPLPTAVADTPRVALIVDYASRLRDEQQTPERTRELFIAAEKAAFLATPLPHVSPTGTNALFNPIIWLVNRPNDVPYWFTVDNERIHTSPVSLPDADTRRDLARILYSGAMPAALRDFKDGEAAFAKALAQQTHNMSLNALRDIVSLATRRALPASDIDQAVQSYRVGETAIANPWRGAHLRDAIRRAQDELPNRVKGQPKSVTKVLDILKRTSTGLTGAQSRGTSARPRGVLFFAGPTGVGKTEMAKAIAEVVFGDESAYLRFDMSEFSAEHSADRLIGAPPGYVGFDQGGELTNALREQPFRVILFDEIDKAHGRILDKFLQILEDGRLTDGRGDTVHFSEALIIFTSNLGVSRRRADGSVEILVTPKDAPADFERNLMAGVRDFFVTELRRPELLNRIGDNVVVFNFITPETGNAILEGMLSNVKNRAFEEHEVRIELTTGARDSLQSICASNLDSGGRGVGSRLETAFINPLSRLLFESNPAKGTTLTIKSIVEDNGIYSLSTS